MKRVLLVLSIIMLLASCQSKSGKRQKVRDTTPTEKITYEEFVIKDGVLVIDEVFTVKGKYKDGNEDMVYSLYKDNVYVEGIYTYHNMYLQSRQPITDIKNILMSRYNKTVAPPKLKPFNY